LLPTRKLLNQGVPGGIVEVFTSKALPTPSWLGYQCGWPRQLRSRPPHHQIFNKKNMKDAMRVHSRFVTGFVLLNFIFVVFYRPLSLRSLCRLTFFDISFWLPLWYLQTFLNQIWTKDVYI
jgi:hypothetical protein